jgi:hypothetical protein
MSTLHRDCDFQLSALAGFDLKLALQGLQALFNPEQTEAAGVRVCLK